MKDPAKADDPLKTILLAAGDEDLREVVHIFLERPGLHLVDAHNSVVVLRLAKEMLPHLLLLDATLPGIRDLKIVHALRNDEETADIPIMMLTAEEDQEAVDRGRAAGVAHYLVTPFDPPVLVQAVEEILGPFHDAVPSVH